MLDYGAGNVRSLVNAVEKLGYHIEMVKEPNDILNAEVGFLVQHIYRPPHTPPPQKKKEKNVRSDAILVNI